MFNRQMRRKFVSILSYALIIGLVFGAVGFSQTALAQDTAQDTEAAVVGIATIMPADPTANVNVREGPSMDYPVIRTVRADTRVGVLGQSGAAWLAIRLADGTEGWVARFLTDFTDTVQTMAAPPLEAPAAVGTPVAAQPPLAPPPTTATTIYASPIALDQPPLGPPPSIALVTEPHTVTIAPIVHINVNVREGPSTAHRVVQTVAPGTHVSVLAQDATNLWIYVRLPNGNEGWIARYLTNFVGTVPQVTDVTAGQPPLAPPASEPAVDTPELVEVEPGVMVLPGEWHDLIAPRAEQALDQNWRTLPEGEVHWYSFQHPGDSMRIQVWMDSEPNEAAGFRVYRADQAQAIMGGRNPDDFEALGRGTHNPNEPGNLFWRGAFSVAGRYYVMVEPGGLGDIPYTIYGAGPGYN